MRKKNVKRKSFLANSKPSTVISLRYAFIAFLSTLVLMFAIPRILNYGPGTINTDFDIQMSYISYTTQFLIIAGALFTLIIVALKIALREIDKWDDDVKNKRKISKEEKRRVRKRCIDLPYAFYAIEIGVPFVIAIAVLALTGSHAFTMIAKVVILIECFCVIAAVISFIFSKELYDEILSKTYVEGDDIGYRVNLRERTFILIIPIVFVAVIFTALVGYSSTISDKADLYYNMYNRILSEKYDSDRVYTINEIEDIASKIELLNETDRVFLMKDDSITNVQDKEISYFIQEYMKQVVDQNNGRIYDSYGVDTQGSSIKLNTEDGICYVGILFELDSHHAVVYMIVDTISWMILVTIVVNIFGNSLSKSLEQINHGFKDICDNSDKTSLLPVISNDEIGDLVLSFNDIQKLNTSQIEDIQNKQNMLIERERLASLGQMVGGIAHSLKTPIFSISGGVEGLNELVEEFDQSIEDPEVNDQDMHEIAQDMNTWIQKIKDQLSYMSEVITTVKGQAVNLSGDDTVEFTISELFSHTNILMKHELQTALITLNIENGVSDNISIHGNINSLVQVLNNLISNSIQAYKGEPNKIIELKARTEDNNILISVKDYGPGLPDVVKDKLFKEMITTKGKEGTGLGVFMSYSMIKAKFNGDIKFETSKDGTEFIIYLPLGNKIK